ncbi:hypothetical protein SAMN04487944_11526 [Gracilibacillus ureilyticus]|uniref:N-acetyltransferase domain-containing protein n=1 Tax=Gracilibacillus ureilyticus TaxID=531814 RepID=A0A1H9TWX6_9BACI|nr:GNAT family N-acetyltransferase [Gracilibacillus ureilyticus]SES01508.1 hypothetical protein SAMN04487944_11526 [Gracilibacillus ureilyticus]
MVVTKILAEKLEKSEIDLLTSRLTSIKKMEGNPMGVEVKLFGNASAFSVKNIPGPSFNTVKGLQAGDEPFIEQIIDFYKQKEIPVRFEISPANASPELFTYLHRSGCYQLGFHTVLYKTNYCDRIEEMNSKISIRELRENEFDIFAEIYTKGFAMPAFLKSGVAQNNQVLYNSDCWTFYLAFIENEPSGIGVMFRKEGIASLAAATTLPEFRQRGVQSSLIRKRMIQAFSENCHLITGQAQFGSVSQNNMERAGMKIAYTKAIWGKG